MLILQKLNMLPNVGGSLEISGSIDDGSVGGSLEISGSIDDGSVGGSVEISGSIDDDNLGRNKKKKKKTCPSVSRGPETRRTGPRIAGPRRRDGGTDKAINI
jgi:hypothetical protein